MDFCHPLDCFASAGQDGAVKLWSRGLALLRDVVFPQPLTAVAFRRVLSMDFRRRLNGCLPNGYLVFVSQTCLRSVKIVKFLKVSFPGLED